MKIFLGYVVNGLAGLVGIVVSKYAGPELGALAGGAIAVGGGRLLHLADPPAAKP